jgi:hypothetical protein
MRKIITQHYTVEQKPIFDLVNQKNLLYSVKNGFDYILNSSRRYPEKAFYWEKIAWINELLSTTPDNSLIVYEDIDSINIGGDLVNALPSGYDMGMVQLRGGLGGTQKQKWFNSGVIIMKNKPEVRKFWVDVFNTNTPEDEIGIHQVLQNVNGNYEYSTGKQLYSLDIEYNVWSNNLNLCKEIYIRTFHGMAIDSKISQIQEFLKTI